MEYKNTKQKMEILITERKDIIPLLNMSCMKRLNLTYGRTQLIDNNQSEKEREFDEFPNLFENNRTKKDTENIKQLEQGYYPVEQKPTPNPLHLQEDVAIELEKLTKAGYLEKLNNVDEDCFISPVVLTVKNSISVTIALDSWKSNDLCVKRRPHMEHLVN